MKRLLSITSFVIFIGLTSVNWTPEDAGITLGVRAIPNGRGTIVSPDLDGGIPQGQNVLYCATFQMAWDAAGKTLGRPIRLQPGCAMADSLNRRSFNRRWVDESSVFTTDGLVGEGVLDDIDTGTRRISSQASKLLGKLKKSSKAGDFVFYAMLHKDLEFGSPFGQLGNWKVGDHKVPWFGFSPDQKDTGTLRKQVLVHHYASKDQLVVEILTQQPGDQLLLAKLPEAPESIASVSRDVLARLKKSPPHAEANDLLAVPNIVVAESTRFSQLEGQRLVDREMFIRHALQTIDFRLDEKGVKLDSEAAVSFGCSAQQRRNPRLIILDPPFALVMKRSDAPQAYFVAWFGNADHLKSR